MRYITLNPSSRTGVTVARGSHKPQDRVQFPGTPPHSLIAQLAEHGAVNSGVPGSSPGGGVGRILVLSN